MCKCWKFTQNYFFYKEKKIVIKKKKKKPTLVLICNHGFQNNVKKQFPRYNCSLPNKILRIGQIPILHTLGSLPDISTKIHHGFIYEGFSNLHAKVLWFWCFFHKRKFKKNPQNLYILWFLNFGKKKKRKRKKRNRTGGY